MDKRELDVRAILAGQAPKDAPVTVKGTSVVGTAKLDDLANRKFPYKVASVAEFPGLVV